MWLWWLQEQMKEFILMIISYSLSIHHMPKIRSTRILYPVFILWNHVHLTLFLNKNLFFCVTVSSEVGRAVWLRFSPPLPSSGPQPSFMAHLSGAVVGISMGLLILRSYEESLYKQCSWWVLIFSFITFLLFAIFWNIFAYELLGVQIPPPPWWHALEPSFSPPQAQVFFIWPSCLQELKFWWTHFVFVTDFSSFVPTGR